MKLSILLSALGVGSTVAIGTGIGILFLSNSNKNKTEDSSDVLDGKGILDDFDGFSEGEGDGDTEPVSIPAEES